MEETKHSLLYPAVVVLFYGILLTGAIFFLTGTFVERETTQAPACYDDSVIEGSGFDAQFCRAVFRNRSILSFIRECEYRLFHIVQDENILAGKNGFLFQIEDSETGYNYLKDRMGQAKFNEEEYAAVLAYLNEQKAQYEAAGAQYLLVVIPNAGTIYREYLPLYLRGGVGQTRLAGLVEYLTANGCGDMMLDTTAALLAAKEHEAVLYDNTENLPNALGMYYVYQAVCEHLSEEQMGGATPAARDTLTFFARTTTGKALARDAGLENIVLNHTVSLSNSTPSYYRMLYHTGALARTVITPANAQLVNPSPHALLLQFTEYGDGLQCEPFFSNTFGEVTYQMGLDFQVDVMEESAPQTVIQFIHESELSNLLPHA